MRKTTSRSAQSKLWHSPITLEFEIVSGATDAVVSPSSGANVDFNVNHTSTVWRIEDVRLLAGTVTPGNGLHHSYAEHVLSGKSLSINYSMCTTSLHTCALPNSSAIVARAASGLVIIVQFGLGPRSSDWSTAG